MFASIEEQLDNIGKLIVYHQDQIEHLHDLSGTTARLGSVGWLRRCDSYTAAIRKHIWAIRFLIVDEKKLMEKADCC